MRSTLIISHGDKIIKTHHMAIGKDTLLNIMAMEAETVDTNKADGRPVVEISSMFMKSFDDSLVMYDRAVDALDAITNGQGFSDDFGVCNACYRMIYITPHDIASYIDYLFKAVSNRMISCSINDMEKFAVEMAKRFIIQNSGEKLDRDNIFANGKYTDPRTETMMDLLVQSENTYFDRCVCSKYDMEQRAESIKDDFAKMKNMHFAPTMKAVVKALPDTIKDAMQESLRNGVACCNCDVMMRYIEAFILFTISLNTITLQQLIGYVQPMSTFIKKEASKYKTESFTDTAFNGYIMECSILKTNDINIRSRIPFDCNMRNIVLQDVTPNFKDTKSALHFMLKDNRSPIHVLLIQYSTKKEIPIEGNCIPALELFRPWFNDCAEQSRTDLQREYDRVGFLTDVNWLDKIAYGNQFMDGNYRLDAAGNENRHPIVEVLGTLHKMYCGCNLKTNTELADQILNISGMMHSVIENQYAAINRQLTTDILAVLGDCFTRCVLKLYHNNCTVIVASDDMDDTMIPGYAYCEQFVMEADDAKPEVTVDGPNTVPKTGVLSKIASIFKAFINWIEKKLSNVPVLFDKFANKHIKYIQGHQKLNEEIGEAFANGKFSATLKNFPMYKIPARTIIDKSVEVKSVMDEFLNNPQMEIDAKAIKSKIYPIETIATNATDDKQEAKWLQNYILFSKIEPGPDDLINGKMTAEQWKNVYTDLASSYKLVDEVCKAMAKSLKDAMGTLEKMQKDEQRQAEKAQNNQQQNGQQPQQPTGRAQQLFNILQSIVKNYQMNAVNSLTRTFFNTYYDCYKKVVDNYQAQAKTQNVGGEVQQNVDNQQSAE